MATEKSDQKNQSLRRRDTARIAVPNVRWGMLDWLAARKRDRPSNFGRLRTPTGLKNPTERE